MTFAQADIRDFVAPSGPPGIIVCNPPYGERIGEGDDLPDLYRALGDAIRRSRGWHAYVFASREAPTRATGHQAQKANIAVQRQDSLRIDGVSGGCKVDLSHRCDFLPWDGSPDPSAHAKSSVLDESAGPSYKKTHALRERLFIAVPIITLFIFVFVAAFPFLARAVRLGMPSLHRHMVIAADAEADKENDRRKGRRTSYSAVTSPR